MKKIFLTCSGILSLFIPSVTVAETFVYCGNLPGCDTIAGVANIREFFSSSLLFLANNIPMYAYALGVLFIMVGGVYMVFSAGRDDWVTKGKNTIMWAALGIAATSFARDIVTIIQLQVQGRVRGDDLDLILSLNNTVISTIFDLLNVTLLAVAVFSGMWMVLSRGKQEEFDKGRNAMFYAAIGAIIINVAWTIANAIATI